MRTFWSHLQQSLVQVDKKAVDLVNAKFRSIFSVDPPSEGDPPGVVGAALACFRVAVGTGDASRFVPDLKGGSLPFLGLLAFPRPDVPAAVTSVGAASLTPGASEGGAIPAGSAAVSGDTVHASGGTASGSSGDSPRSGGGGSWLAVDAHNLDGKKLTHPVQLLAYHISNSSKEKVRQLRGCKDGVLSSFSATHIGDMGKALKPAARATAQQRIW